MTSSSSEQPPKEYTITEEEVEIIESHLDNKHCQKCPYEGGGVKSGIKSFIRSRPHTSAPAPEPDGCSFRVAKMDAMYDNGYAEGAKAAREQAYTKFMDEIRNEEVDNLGYIDLDSIENIYGTLMAEESLRSQQEAEQQ
jgi:hypothetical protein